MKKLLILMMVVMVALAMVTGPVDAKSKPVKAKAVACKKAKKAKKIKTAVVTFRCPCCGTGTHEDCVYWYIDGSTGKGQHMTPKQIEEFEFYESHYQVDGEWIVK